MINLIQQMTTLNPIKRINTKKALEHPAFNSLFINYK